jgi:tRNA nucleotidyltransferase (CCA-adding enzyme)
MQPCSQLVHTNDCLVVSAPGQWQLDSRMQALTRFFPQSHWRFLQTLAWRCHSAGGKACLVGGCVRSALLRESVVDFDVEVFGLPPERLEPVLRDLAPVNRVGKAFGIYKLAGWPVDIGLPRLERKHGTGHRGFEVSIDPDMPIEQAARRRDFTVNAIYFDISAEELVDPLGGIEDLRAGRLRHCSDRFPEDPLRVLRAMQLAARLPADVDAATVQLCAGLSPEGLSRERYFAEWEKLLLQGRQPSRGMAFLKACGWLRFFPELAALDGCPQDPRWHPEGDVWAHTLHCMDAFAAERVDDRDEDLIVGLAVLCHDMGKPLTTEIDDAGIRSHGHESAGTAPARTFMQRLNVAGRLIEQVLPLVKCHMRPAMLYHNRSSSAAIRRLARDCGRLDRLLRVFRADAAGRPPLAHDTESACAWLRDQARRLQVETGRPRRLIGGRDLLKRGWQPGPELGKILEAIYERQLDGAFSDRAEALAWLEDQLAGADPGRIQPPLS